MTAEVIARALGGCRAGTGWMACCPAHDDREPSLSIRDGNNGRVLVRCHAGCDQRQVIGSLRARGLWGADRARQSRRPATRAVATTRPGRDDVNRSEVALAIWRIAAPASGTMVEAYLLSRGLRLTPPPTLRFHARLRHPSGGTWPAMVALVTRGMDDQSLAIHRTFLARHGSAKAPVGPQKMMLGPCRGGAVRLAPAGEQLMVGEGIESCLAAMQATGRPAWAALSTSGLRALELPPGVREVLVLADGDEAGEVAARHAALRWLRQGRRVRIAHPGAGLDFNDLLLGRSAYDRGDAV